MPWIAVTGSRALQIHDPDDPEAPYLFRAPDADAGASGVKYPGVYEVSEAVAAKAAEYGCEVYEDDPRRGT
jgi:hypothetical protein